MKVKDPKTNEMREETDDERKAREAAEAQDDDGDGDKPDVEKLKGERDRWKSEARKWEARAKENFSAKVGIPWDDITTAAQKYADAEAKNKTDGEKAEQARKTAEERADKAERDAMLLRVAMRKGLTDVQARRLVGKTEEELEADADELMKTFKPTDEDEDDDRSAARHPLRRPSESLRPGTGKRTEPPIDPKKVVDEAMAR